VGAEQEHTSIYLHRQIARELNLTIKRTAELIRLSYAKVAEYQVIVVDPSSRARMMPAPSRTEPKDQAVAA
jgi:hypothetical protein